MKYLYRTYIVLAIAIWSLKPLFAEHSNNKQVIVSGVITDAGTGEPVPFATLYLQDSYSGVASDVNGFFVLVCESGKSNRLTVSSLGYQSVDTLLLVHEEIKINFTLKSMSFALEEVVISAQENQRGNSTSSIGKEALEHIQPSSLADALQLLPGGLTKEIKMNSPAYMRLRQAGSDVNTSLGTAFVIDGMTLGNDAVQNVYGMTTSPSVSYGVDLRTISTDRIESIEVIRGIPSAAYGNLTSGVVKIEMKRGKTPLEGRVKTDFNNKLFAIGKGILLPAEKGTLNLDLDYTHYTEDPRNELSSYSRFTASGRFQHRIGLKDDAYLKLNVDLNYTGSFDKTKSDPDAMNGLNDYQYNDYNNSSLSSTVTLSMPRKIVKELNYSLSASYTKTMLKREKLQTPGVMPLPTATEEGVHEAQYLPAQYTSFLTVDGRPLNLTSKIQAKTHTYTGRVFHHLIAGAEWQYDKNFGEGEIYDPERPPYPGSGTSIKTSRPRPYSEIPAIRRLGLYIEDRLDYSLGKSTLSASVGLRATPVLLSGKYEISGKWYLEPRFNTKLELPVFEISGKKTGIALTAGAGRHYRFPTQAQLYPAPLFFDYVQLNYYTQNPDLRLLNVRTWIIDPANYHIQPVLNFKVEAGMQIKRGKFTLDITLFNEISDNGFSSENTFVSHTYQKYDPTSVNPASITKKPVLQDFTFVNDTISSLYSIAQNSSSVHKKGIEYTLNLGKIEPLYTSVRINGAWFQTQYKLNASRYYKPGVVINSRTYPYVGVYDYHKTDDKTMSQFNTNLNFDTHIPKLRLVFTSSFQTVWFTNTTQSWNNGLPTGYIDDAGRYYNFDPARADNPIMKYLVDTYLSHYFKPTVVPLALNMHLKLDKEIGDRLKIGFYVNRILSYLPAYKTKYNTKETIQRRKEINGSPFFGAEINIKI